MAKLDEIDIKLLKTLQQNAKANTKELMEELHISKTPIYERMRRLENEGIIKGYTAIVECYSTGGHYDFLLKVVLKDLEAHNTFVFEKLTKAHGIVKMQSSFVLSEIKQTNVLNIGVTP